ncbi:hypothetical protein HKX48_007090 [Thoreauomyces humboldtii]|nr:hypothetical protein HKX48_007090 [Thoreauomyces humboldtii]
MQEVIIVLHAIVWDYPNHPGAGGPQNRRRAIGVRALILAVRTPSEGETARQEIAAKSGLDASRVDVWELDLSSFDSVKRFVEKVRKLERLDVMCENAGIAGFGFKKTDNGWEEIFQVNRPVR